MRANKGQAIVLVLLFLTLALMVVLLTFNASILSLNKSKLQYTADNAAYSLAVLAARDLNYKAYTNRAMVANQVAVAQIVGLSSYLQMHTTFVQNASAVFAPVPGVGQTLGAMSQVMQGANQVAQPILENVLLPAEEAVLRSLSISQTLFHTAGLAQALTLPANVVRSNDPNASLVLAQNIMLSNQIHDHWVSMQSTFDRNNRGQQYNDHVAIIMNSRDPFSMQRSRRWGIPFSIDLVMAGFVSEKRGGSDLILNNNQAESWTSVDTISAHITAFPCISLFGCSVETPVGWGATTSDTRANINSNFSRSMWGGTRARNPVTSLLATQNTRQMSGLLRYSGIQPFYDFSTRETNGVNETANITVVVAKREQNINTSSKIQWGHDQIDPATNEQLPHGQMTAISSANIYYSRPRDLWPRGDNFNEYGNIYNPYWQPRLSETTNAARLQVRLLMGII
ncbi:MAG: hypothetical protein JJU30_12890 [Alkalimonas sp.]|nr:hypothetical protein [Alkalimonas sp.]